MTSNLIMNQALNKYHTQVDEGKWCQLTKQDKEILTLTAAFSKLQNKLTKKAAILKETKKKKDGKKDNKPKEEKSKKKDYPD